MIRDKNLVFLNNVALGAAGTTFSDIIDLGTERDIGIGYDIELDMRIRTAATSAGAATLQLQLQTAIDAAFTTPLVLNQTPAYALATLVAGFEPARWDINSPTNRFLRIAVIVGTAAFTGGTIDAAVVVDRQANRAYPSGYTIGA